MAGHEPSGNDAGSAEMWDEMYRSRARVWSGKPNAQLVAEASGLPPGTALDLGCGEGADALWLAERGWTVTAVDVSAVALERAAAHAADAGQARRITWLRQDLADWVPDHKFDLVSAQFLHSTVMPWQQPLHLAAASVRLGGTLLVTGHHPHGLPPWGSHGHEVGMFFTPEQVVEELRLRAPAWRLDVAESRERKAAGPDGQDAVIGDAVLRATRLAGS
jgi:SAM-dependent methyltransferase